MRVLSETYAIDASEAGYIHIRLVRLKNTRIGPMDMGGPISFERQNLGWVVDEIRSRLSAPRLPDAKLSSGHDHLWVFESGSDQDPGIDLHNERSQDVPHGGAYAIWMRTETASKLVEELTKLPADPPRST